jgi:hypothetical protein
MLSNILLTAALFFATCAHAASIPKNEHTSKKHHPHPLAAAKANGNNKLVPRFLTNPTQWAKVSLCTASYKVGAYAIIPLGVCTSFNVDGSYSLIASVTGSTYSVQWYNSLDCTNIDNYLYVFTASAACGPGNTDKEYALEVLNALPSTPTAAGVLETWYLSGDCTGSVSGYFWAESGACVQDPEYLLSYYQADGYDFTVDVVSSTEGTFTLFSSTDLSCSNGIAYGPYTIKASGDIPLECTSLVTDYESSIADMGPGASRLITFPVGPPEFSSTSSNSDTP